MVAKQRIRMANEKHSKNITQRGNVAKTLRLRGIRLQTYSTYHTGGKQRDSTCDSSASVQRLGSHNPLDGEQFRKTVTTVLILP
ncbi:hypothetical protein F2P81_021050 [Scophthalmus maximus]|uniref:Stress-associated endoplasmic reticulum protein n=1 Tax=Scophthalmus maximus TaxID=52904 RepID=A0A6A4RW79_SCOMX|nr:hypothetical protein F2P81_021050 [Scophthalmus maximus]